VSSPHHQETNPATKATPTCRCAPDLLPDSCEACTRQNVAHRETQIAYTSGYCREISPTPHYNILHLAHWKRFQTHKSNLLNPISRNIEWRSQNGSNRKPCSGRIGLCMIAHSGCHPQPLLPSQAILETIAVNANRTTIKCLEALFCFFHPQTRGSEARRALGKRGELNGYSPSLEAGTKSHTLSVYRSGTSSTSRSAAHRPDLKQ
jgi:hypothetical protein